MNQNELTTLITTHPDVWPSLTVLSPAQRLEVAETLERIARQLRILVAAESKLIFPSPPAPQYFLPQ
jgi:hypothetical protein